jgi:DNA-3-methyladenine glycosylase
MLLKERSANVFNSLRLKRIEQLPMLTPLPKAFYEPSAKVVAMQLLGHFLVRNTPLGLAGGPIVETEAYLSDDPACHGAPGPTPRNRVMFGPAGHGYVYLIYGYHFCVNAVCRPAGVAEAVLVRAIEPRLGQEFMHRQRPVSKLRDLTNGPAKLCEALNIDRGLDGIDLCNSQTTLWIAKNPDVENFLKKHGPIVTTTRIGITRAAALPLRFYLDGSEYVSRRAAGGPGKLKSVAMRKRVSRHMRA